MHVIKPEIQYSSWNRKSNCISQLLLI